MTLITRKSVLRSPDPSLGNATATDIYLTGLVGRGVNTRKGNQRFFGMKTAYIANFSQDSLAWANTKHPHHYRILRQRSCQGLHLLFESS